MAPANTPPDPSATFDSLWEFDELEPDPEPIPAALAPPKPPPKVPAELRDTLLPPVPLPEYVQTMMELGELDDPSTLAGAHAPRPQPRAPAPLPPPPSPSPPPFAASRTDRPGEPPLGLVLASESELLLPTDAAAPNPSAVVQVRGALGSPPLPGRIAGMNRVAGSVPGPARGAPVIHGAPAPRAPSIAPLPPSSRDALDLMPFEEAAAGRNAGHDEARSVAPPRHTHTPPSRSRTPSSMAGLRLAKTPPPMPAVEILDRITPIESEPPPDSVVDQLRVMQLRFESHNYPGALVLAESILASNPAHAVARRCASSCRDALAEKYLSRIGGRNCVPRVAMPPEEMHRLALDHRAGFLLSFIDGAMSVDEVLDVSSMPELDALRIMFELQEQGAILIEPPARRPGRR